MRSDGRAREFLLLTGILLGLGLVLVLTTLLVVSGLERARDGDAGQLLAAPTVATDSVRDHQAMATNLVTPPTATPLPATATPPVGKPPRESMTVATPRPASSPAPQPTTATASQVLEYGPSDRREVALTFDAGADRGYGAEILDLLAKEGIKASFGMTGMYAEANSDLVRRMVEEGHPLINHTWSHPSFTGVNSRTAPLTQAKRWEELRRTEDLVRELTGDDLRPYFRPPYGDYDASVLEDLATAGYTVTVLWSCDSRDSLGATADEILDRCVEGARPGRIILLHIGG